MDQSTTVTICQEIEEVIFHPAEYVQEKVKKQGVSCLFFPHCCTPAWPAFPECYVIQWIKKRDAWEEIVKTFTCEDYSFSIEDAFKAWLRNLLIPVPGFKVIPEELTDLFGTYIGAAYEAANAIPEDIRNELIRLDNDIGAPYSEANVNQARWLSSDHVLAQRIWPGGDVLGITYYNLIIVSDAFFDGSFCENASMWAHELVHVHQYNEMGWNQLLTKYLADGMVQQWSDIQFEQEAILFEGQALENCLGTQIQIAPVSPLQQAGIQKFRQMMDLLQAMEQLGEIQIDNGVIRFNSPEAERKLLDAVPRPTASDSARLKRGSMSARRQFRSRLEAERLSNLEEPLIAREVRLPDDDIEDDV